MKIYTIRLDTPPSTTTNGLALSLPYHLRQKSRFRAQLPSGESVGFDLPRTQALTGGSWVAAEDGSVLQINAEPETLMQAKSDDWLTLLKAAYHLGNRHVPLMITATAVYFEPDHVLADMLAQMNIHVSTTLHPFEPESGAYAQHHHAAEALKPTAAKPELVKLAKHSVLTPTTLNAS